MYAGLHLKKLHKDKKTQYADYCSANYRILSIKNNL